jgi:hypothetical protein
MAIYIDLPCRCPWHRNMATSPDIPRDGTDQIEQPRINMQRKVVCMAIYRTKLTLVSGLIVIEIP